MPIGIDVATKTVVLSDASDLKFIDDSLKEVHEGPVDYTRLANTWAVALGQVMNIAVTDKDGWAFGSTDPEVAQMLQSRLTGGITEIVQVVTGQVPKPAVVLTAPQAKILNHTLGLNLGRGEAFRNHFVASEGHDDLPVIKELVLLGLMGEGRRPVFLHDADLVFCVTQEGKAALAAYRWPGCCCPPRGFSGAWAAGPCPTHQGLRARGNR